MSRVRVCVVRSCGTIAPAARPWLCPVASAEAGQRLSRQSVRARALFSRRTRHRSAWRSSPATIARMMLAPCSTSSMLSASLRPGPWPGLRALTTPARGTDWQWRDGDNCDDGLHETAYTRLTRTGRGRMVGSSLQCRPALLRFATTASGARIPPTAPRARFGAHPSQHRSLLQDHRSAVDLHTVGCEPHDFSRRRVLRTTRRNEAAFTGA